MQDTEQLVCFDVLNRQQIGLNKYGTTVADNKLLLKEWMQHAYEECLDQAIYLKRAMQELEEGGSREELVLKWQARIALLVTERDKLLVAYRDKTTVA